MLWLILLLSFTVLAQSSPPNACHYVTLDSTVSQFCYTTLLSKFAYKRLNFTIVTTGPPNMGVTLEFEPLPENRQVDVEVVDNSNGLKPWARLSNSFVDSVLSGGLPYDIILPYLNNTVDSPIASQCPSTSSQSSETGDVDINDLLDDLVGWWAPLIAVTTLGPVFAIVFIIVGCSFCWCRLCGRCGGNLQQDYHEEMDTRCFVLYIVLLCLVALLFVGTVLAFVSNEKLNDSIENFNNTVNTAIDDSLDFVNDAQTEANLTVERYNEIIAFVQCEIDYTHISVGGALVDIFEDTVDPLISNSLSLADQLNSSIDALIQLNKTVERLLGLSEKLEMELNNLTNQVAKLQTDCALARLPEAVCNEIPTVSYTVTVNYSVVDNVSSILDQLQQIDDIETHALEANNTFYGIPCEIRDQIRNQTVDFIKQADDFHQSIVDITTDIDEAVNKAVNENGFIGDARAEASGIQETLDTYNTPRYIVSIVICSLILLVIVVLICGLILGGYGFKKNIYPQDRSPTSNCGGIILMVATGSMFVLAVILLLLASFMFFLGANLLKVCYSIAEDPPNGLPSYELYSRIADDPSLWGGYLLGCYILDNGSVPLTVTDILNGCRDNGPLYQVARLAMSRKLNLQNLTNISSQIPNLDDLFNRLRDEISFTPDQILTEDTRDSLTQYSKAGLQSIDYLGYIDQINTAISNLDVDGLVTTMEMLRTAFVAAYQPALVAQTDMIIVTTERINDTTLTEIMNLTDVLETQIITLNTTANQMNQSVEAVLDAADRATAQLLGENGTENVINQARAVLDRVIAYADSYANWAIHTLENQIGRCRPLYATYSNVYYEACEDAVDGINGFWLAIGWCVLFFIPTLIFAVWLSHYFRRMMMYRYPNYQYEPDELDGLGTYRRMKETKT